MNINLDLTKNDFENFVELCRKMGSSSDKVLAEIVKDCLEVQSISYEIKPETPNQETLEAIQEVEEVRKNPSQYKFYSDVDTMMKEILAGE